MISPDHLLKELADLWVSLGKQPQEDGAAGVLRACSMTLAVLAEESDDAAEIGETVAALMPEHPSRTIVIRVRPESGRELSARVFAQCWKPFGQRRQICCEQVEIAAGDAGLPELPAVLRPLAAPDLPVVLWCRSPRLFFSPAFAEFAAGVDKLLVDSEEMDGAARALGELSRYLPQSADLTWTRLTRWRELLARIFENRDHLAALRQPVEARISHTGGAPPVRAWYMAAWLLESLRAAGGTPAYRFVEVPGEGNQLRAIEVAAGAERFSVALVGGTDCVEVRAAGLVNRTSFPRPRGDQLIGEELGLAGRDRVFETVLAGAARLVGGA